MKVIAHDLGDFYEIFLLPLADWHIGDPHSDGERITEWLDYLKKTPNAFAILNGDLMNTAVRTGISDIYGETIFKNDGIDTTQLTATQLGIGERYSPTAAYLYIRFGKLTGRCHHGEQVCYTIYAAHGSGGGRTEGAKVNRLLQLASICDADIYIHSHTHLPAITKTAYFRPWPTRSSVQKVDRLFVNTAAALNYGGYGELASFKPASLDTPIIKLDGRKKKATAWL